MRRYLICLFAFSLLILPLPGSAKDYPIFDGQKYNGLYYPRIDNIEYWGKPAHMEFHIYQKDTPVHLEAKVIERGGQRVLLVNYHLTNRNEKVCRSVVAPANFNPDAPLYFYKDASDSEYDNIYVTVSPLPLTRNLSAYAAPSFSTKGCDEEDMPKSSGENGRGVASGSDRQKAPASMVHPDEGVSLKTPSNEKSPAPEKKHELIDYQNNALPFNF